MFNLTLADKRELLALIWQALSRSPVPPTVVGTPASQSGVVSSFDVVVSTVNVGTVTVDTGFAPPNNHGAGLDGKYIMVDRTAHTVRSGNAAGSIRTFGGTLAIAGAPIFGGATGDAGLATGVPSFGVSGGNTLTVTFTPPGGYVGTIEWQFMLNVTVD